MGRTDRAHRVPLVERPPVPWIVPDPPARAGLVREFLLFHIAGQGLVLICSFVAGVVPGAALLGRVGAALGFCVWLRFVAWYSSATVEGHDA